MDQASPVDPYKTGQEINSVRAEVKRQVGIILDDVTLRKWCVEQTVKLISSLPAGSTVDAATIVKFFYNFVIDKENKNAERA